MASTSGNVVKSEKFQRCKLYNNLNNTCSSNTSGAYSKKSCKVPCGCCVHHCLMTIASGTVARCIHVKEFWREGLIDDDGKITPKGEDFLEEKKIVVNVKTPEKMSEKKRSREAKISSSSSSKQGKIVTKKTTKIVTEIRYGNVDDEEDFETDEDESEEPSPKKTKLVANKKQNVESVKPEDASQLAPSIPPPPLTKLSPAVQPTSEQQQLIPSNNTSSATPSNADSNNWEQTKASEEDKLTHLMSKYLESKTENECNAVQSACAILQQLNKHFTGVHRLLCKISSHTGTMEMNDVVAKVIMHQSLHLSDMINSVVKEPNNTSDEQLKTFRTENRNWENKISNWHKLATDEKDKLQLQEKSK